MERRYRSCMPMLYILLSADILYFMLRTSEKTFLTLAAGQVQITKESICANLKCYLQTLKDKRQETYINFFENLFRLHATPEPETVICNLS